MIYFSVKRAKDYHKKQNDLDHLKLLAQLKNEDEFRSDMVHTNVENGQIFIDEEKKLPKNALKIYRDNEANYLNMNIQHLNNKLKKELNAYHLISNNNPTITNNTIKRKYTNKNIKKLQLKMNKTKRLIWGNDSNKKKAFNNNHIIYFDSHKDRINFDASKHFNTPKELINNVHNRLKINQLSDDIILDKNNAEHLKQKSELKLRDIKKNIKMIQNMKSKLSTVNMQKKLAKKGRYKVIKKVKNRHNNHVKQRIIKWQRERKK